MRNLMVISLAIFTSSAWSQQPSITQPTAWPQILFWTLNPSTLQPQLWAQPTAMPRPAVPPGIPFPTPFWLWPLPPQPSSLAPPSSSASLPKISSPPTVSAAQGKTLPPDIPVAISPAASPPVSPQVQEATLAETTATTPATTEVSITKPEQAPAEAMTPIAPTEVDATTSTIEAPLIPAPLDGNIASTKTETKPASEAKTQKKARTAKKNVTKKVRKLCWKDGRLDVCP